MKINKELLSNEITHIYKNYKVKVFWSTLQGKYNKIGRTVSAEIMEGPHKGKLTTVYLDNAIPYLKQFEEAVNV